MDEVNKWEQEHFREDEIRSKATAAKNDMKTRCEESSMVSKGNIECANVAAVNWTSSAANRQQSGRA
jgi:hypothetical protein